MIRDLFEADCAVFVLDMSGFSVSVQRHGIIHHLAFIRRMHVVVRPAVEEADGRVVKFDADNCFAVFDSVNQAVEAAKQIHVELKRLNRGLAIAERIEVSIGIGYGTILLGEDDLFGDEVNQAAKLGEDLAQAGEVLLTEAAAKKFRNSKVKRETLHFAISGISMNAVKVGFR